MQNFKKKKLCYIDYFREVAILKITALVQDHRFIFFLDYNIKLEILTIRSTVKNIKINFFKNFINKIYHLFLEIQN